VKVVRGMPRPPMARSDNFFLYGIGRSWPNGSTKGVLTAHSFLEVYERLRSGQAGGFRPVFRGMRDISATPTAAESEGLHKSLSAV
jgi:hypothetical protein